MPPRTAAFVAAAGSPWKRGRCAEPEDPLAGALGAAEERAGRAGGVGARFQAAPLPAHDAEELPNLGRPRAHEMALDFRAEAVPAREELPGVERPCLEGAR